MRLRFCANSYEKRVWLVRVSVFLCILNSMTTTEILRTVESQIRTAQEREYFLIHEARYKYILEQIEKITDSLSGGARRGAPVERPQHLRMIKADNSTNLRGSICEDVGREKTRDRTRPSLKILDVGCFPYHLGAALEIMGHDVYGISSTHEPIKSQKIKICNIESDRFPFKDNFFDFVLCTEVLEHLPQSPLHAINEIRRVLMPQGKLLLTTPNIARSINRAKMLLGKSVTYPLSQVLENDGEGSNIYHRHNREYTLKELATLLSHAHFSVDVAECFISYTPFRRRVRPDPLWLKAGKVANYILMLMVSGLRDTLLVIATKNV